STAVAPITTAASPVNGGSTGPVVVQGQPQSTATAQQWTSCFVDGNCPTGGPGAPSRGLLVGLVVGSVIGLLLVGLVVARPRPIRAPPRPQPDLFATGGPGPARTAPRATAPAPPESGGDDPLANLW